MARTTVKKDAPAEGYLATLDKLLGDTPRFEPVPLWLSCGIDLVDWVVGRGFPCGRAVEIYGATSVSKTTLALCLAREVQRLGGMVYYSDSEWGLDFDWANRLGVRATEVDTDRWVYRAPRYVEQGLNGIEYMAQVRAKADTPTLLVYDSVAGGVPKKDSMEEKSLEDNRTPGGRAAVFTHFFENGTLQTIRNRPILLLFLNQVRATISRFPGQVHTPGGEALKFDTSVRLEMSGEEKIIPSGKKEPIGRFVEVKCVKNKTDRPFRKASFPLFFPDEEFPESACGPDNEMSLIYYLKAVKVFGEDWIEFGGKKYRNNQLRDLMVSDRKVYAEIREMAREAFKVRR